MEFSESSTSKLLTTFQRDINRATDSDRSTRKRGLQKLLEDIPWGKKSQREDLKVLVSQNLLKILIGLVADDVEKCRELSLQILKKCIEKCDDITFDTLHSLVVSLCARLSEVPFPEPAEEIRLLVIELLLMIRKHATFVSAAVTDTNAVSQATESNIGTIDEKVVQMLVKALTDGFPSVKRAGAELLCDITVSSPQVVKSYFKPLLKALQGNSSHQHSKTRSITLQAIGKGLCTLGLEEYQTLLRDPIIGTFLRTVSDRTASVRIELGNVCADIFETRVTQCLHAERALLPEDFELVAILFLLHGDVIDEVCAEGKRQIIRAVHRWDKCIPTEQNTEVDVPINSTTAMDVDDGELAMQKIHSSGAGLYDSTTVNSEVIDYEDVSNLAAFVSTNLRSLLSILQEGVEGWTTDSRKRYLRGLNCLILYADSSINAVLPRLLSVLSMQVRDEDAEVRGAAEECCVRLGSQAVPEELLEILLPRVSGAVAGGDTAAQRANAIGVLIHILKGIKIAHTAGRVQNMAYLGNAVASCLAETSLYAFREASLRESVLLLVRTMSECFAEECKSSVHIQQAMCLALMFLCCRCPNEDEVIPEVAQRELRCLAAICTGDATNSSALLAAHYHFLFYHIVTFQTVGVNAGDAPMDAKVDVSDPKNAPKMAFYDTLKLKWESDSPAMAALGVLVREAPGAAWASHALLLPIVTKLVQPKLAPAAGSAEANAQSYASQRGIDTNYFGASSHASVYVCDCPTSRTSESATINGRNLHSNVQCVFNVGEDVALPQAGLVDARLNLLALLEGLVRSGKEIITIYVLTQLQSVERDIVIDCCGLLMLFLSDCICVSIIKQQS